jgi:hypothetical protein
VSICGAGVAASCCAHLLRNAGFPLSLTETVRTPIPAILVSEPTQALLRDVFSRPDLFEGLFQIDRRIVAWGPNAAPVELPHRAVVISEIELLARLRQPSDSTPVDPHWTIYAAHPLPPAVSEQKFGSRTASAISVTLAPSQPFSCWIESLDNGWLFLIPTTLTSGWLISVGAANLLEQSRVIAPQIAWAAPIGGAFPAYPRIIDPLCDTGWLACGAAAMSFDPICGDGTGNAVRESILATAVIRAAAAGEPPELLLAHYRARLTAGMLRHLELCRAFYESANQGPWWEQERSALDRGIAWCRQALGTAGPFHYRLSGFELEKLALPT